jgi:hypothetical protein
VDGFGGNRKAAFNMETLPARFIPRKYRTFITGADHQAILLRHCTRVAKGEPRGGLV